MKKNKFEGTIFDLSEKHVAIFGGSGQIGINTTEILLDAGANVRVFDVISETSFQKKFNDNMSSFFESGKLSYVQIDITNEDSVKNSSDLYAVTGIDVIINHVHYKGSPEELIPNGDFFKNLENYSFDIWKKTLDVNLNGLFLITKYFGEKMISSGGGVLVNTSSTYGLVSPKSEIYGDSGINSPISYATTKSAILNFTKYVAHWSKHNIRANCLSPGGVSNVNQSKEFIEAYESHTPLKRMAKPSDYKGALLFLCSDASSYMTGSNLIVDGGWTAW